MITVGGVTITGTELLVALGVLLALWVVAMLALIAIDRRERGQRED